MQSKDDDDDDADEQDCSSGQLAKAFLKHFESNLKDRQRPMQI